MHTVRVELADPARLRAARRAVDREVAAVRAALARELPRAQLAAGRPVRLSPLLADLVRAALDAARRTSGDVDPTVGAALLRLRYAGSRPWLPTCGSAVGVLERVGQGPAESGAWRGATSPESAGGRGRSERSEPANRAPGWREVRLDGRWLTVPPGILLDLGATAPARTAERCAELVATRYGTGALVEIDGDVATAGAAPPNGWRVGALTLPAGRALGTSRGQVLDPATGRPARRPWRAVTVEAATCVTASAFATAVAVRGDATLPDGALAHLDPAP